MERAKSIKNAVAITAMEGGRPSSFCLELLALFRAITKKVDHPSPKLRRGT